MTPEEREQLREGLKAAGCPGLARAVGDFLGGAYITELRSLLRREVWVATWLEHYNGDQDFSEKQAVFSSEERLIAAMIRAGRNVEDVDIEQYTIDAEVPDGD